MVAVSTSLKIGVLSLIGEVLVHDFHALQGDLNELRNYQAYMQNKSSSYGDHVRIHFNLQLVLYIRDW